MDVLFTLLDSLHDRWVRLLRLLQPQEEPGNALLAILNSACVSLEKNLALYAWHGRHHVAHITSLRERSGW